jgi:hypothetical protein
MQPYVAATYDDHTTVQQAMSSVVLACHQLIPILEPLLPVDLAVADRISKMQVAMLYIQVCSDPKISHIALGFILPKQWYC